MEYSYITATTTLCWDQGYSWESASTDPFWCRAIESVSLLNVNVFSSKGQVNGLRTGGGIGFCRPWLIFKSTKEYRSIKLRVSLSREFWRKKTQQIDKRIFHWAPCFLVKETEAQCTVGQIEGSCGHNSSSYRLNFYYT